MKSSGVQGRCNNHLLGETSSGTPRLREECITSIRNKQGVIPN